MQPSAAIPAMTSSRPTYAERFRCIGSACEDTCCQGWSVPVDRAAWDKYQSLPESPLRVLIAASLVPASADAVTGCKATGAAANPAVIATIRMNGENQCPLLSEDHLCRIQSEVGESFLSYTCATYPRIVASIDGVVETSMALSCPEAARIVLLTPDLLSPAPNPHHRAQAGHNLQQDDSSQPWFLAIREVALAVVRNRAYPLWQRMFLLGVFCRRLDSIAKGELQRSVPLFLDDFEAAVASGALRASMETLPVDRKAQLDVVLRLAGLMLHKSNVRPRFVECIQAFTAGIGNGPGATLDSLGAHYAFAHDRCYAPFFSQHPHILENYLANIILRRQFPFGKEGMRAGVVVEMTREFAMLAAQFALMRGLLIGVAGHHGPAFSTAHVVHTVQAASKHFDHHPEFLQLAYALLVESRMVDARGLAILLRSAEAGAGGDAARPAAPEISAPGREGERSVWVPAPAPPRPLLPQGASLPE
ncbi:MAG TPA: flagellin lysine-N-methylase [Terracidiphilus sp.]|nr:flagellin lysine-N-methylase [Terracidiphilus sp.]